MRRRKNSDSSFGSLDWKQLVRCQKRLFLRFLFELLNSGFSYFFQNTKKINYYIGQQACDAWTKQKSVNVIFFKFNFDEYFEPYLFVRQYVFAIQEGSDDRGEDTIGGLAMHGHIVVRWEICRRETGPPAVAPSSAVSGITRNRSRWFRCRTCALLICGANLTPKPTPCRWDTNGNVSTAVYRSAQTTVYHVYLSTQTLWERHKSVCN